jgi:hypothetical protein
MSTAITFVNTRTGSRVDVRVGPDPLMLLAGLAAAVMLGVDWAGGPSLGWPWYAGATALVHARLYRHALTLPAWGSLALGLMSSGMSMLITGVVIHRMIAQRYRDAGWKIRNTDGELGEYSSRFLAIDRLGFSDSDLLATVRHQLVDGLEKVDETPVTPLPARAGRPGSRHLHSVTDLTTTDDR